jgi:catechol-2,3-dioxygenase
VPDLELATAYYTEVVGLIETARESERVFLKAGTSTSTTRWSSRSSRPTA